jgi:DNA-binding Xre family transcriptional regulator/FtsZ-binding cell division protein ZapB
MKPKNELFMDAIEWLIDNGLAENQGDIAVKAGLGPNLISRIKNGRVKAVSDDAIRALCDRFRELNIDYLRGKSDCISRQQQNANSPHETRRHSVMDDSFLLEKQFQKVYDGIAGQYIEELKERVEEQKQTIAIQRDTIDVLKRENELLRQQLSKYQTDEILSHNPFPVGVADKDQIQPNI